jgi:hypothetical protein
MTEKPSAPEERTGNYSTGGTAGLTGATKPVSRFVRH